MFILNDIARMLTCSQESKSQLKLANNAGNYSWLNNYSCYRIYREL